MKKAIYISLKLGLLSLLLLWAVNTQNLNEIQKIIFQFDFFYFLIFFLLFITSAALSSTNLFLLLKPLSYKLSWGYIFRIDLLSLAGAFYTPGGIGGMGILMYMMSNKGVDIKDSGVVVLVDKQITGIVAIIFMTVYLIVYPINKLLVNWEMIITLIIIAILIVVISFFSKLVRTVFKSIVSRVYLYKDHYPILLTNLILTIGIYSLNVLQYIACFYAIGVPIPDWQLIFFTYSLLLLINYLPISIGGLGVGELTGVVLWTVMGLTSEQILSGFVILRFFAFISTLFLSGTALFYLKNNLLKSIK